jgi:tight adherence protein B
MNRRQVVCSTGAVAGLGLLIGGPVAGVVGAAYAGLAGRAVLRRAARRQAEVARQAALDGLSALAADLRAGLPPFRWGAGLPPAAPSAAAVSPAAVSRAAVSPAGLPAGGSPADDRIGRLTGAVWRLAERTGAPAADLVERIEADARAADRAAASATAQVAGAQSTALLLAGLPVGGIGLGLAIGADPVHVLLRTPVGAACAIGAVLLQCAGLLWAERLTGGVAR